MITRSVFARGAASIILAGALAVGMSGCVFIAPKATLIQYAPSDGINGSVGDVKLRNVLGIVSEDGEAISLMVTLVNEGSSGVKVNFQWESDGEKVTESRYVGAGTTASFGTEEGGEQILVLGSGVGAGELLPVYVQYGDNEGQELLVPVLDATGDYAELAPAE